MTVEATIAGIVAKAEEVGLNRQQVSDRAKIPKSTVDNIWSGRTTNPTLQTIIDLADAVGYPLDSAPALPCPVVPESDNSSYLKHIISMYERQLADKDIAHDRELSSLRFHHNTTVAEKNRWITILGLTCFVLVTGIIIILLIDITNPTVGWYRREMANYAGSASAAFENAVITMKEWFSSLHI